MAHRRRGVGVGRKGGNPKFSKKANELQETSLESAMEVVGRLQTKLSEFATTYQTEIQTDPAFRTQFLQLCGPLNIDPLVSSKSFWAKTLGVGMGDFYYELAVKVVEICAATKERTGGIISLEELYRILLQREKKRTAIKTSNISRVSSSAADNRYSKSDITIAISKLQVLGGGFRTMKIGSEEMVVSVPTELDQDHCELMELAQANNGCLCQDTIATQLKDHNHFWSNDRIDRAVTLLLQQGMAWQDYDRGENYLWFPSIWKNILTGNSMD